MTDRPSAQDLPVPDRARELLVALLSEVGEDCSADRAMERAGGHGLVFVLTGGVPTTLYEPVWQHPRAAAFNASSGGAPVSPADTCHFTLYARRGERRSGAPYLVAIGLGGSPVTYEVWPAGPIPGASA
jgi:hypothetical protein